MAKQEMPRVNINDLGISEMDWTGWIGLVENGLEWVNLTQMTITSTSVGKNPLEEME